MSSARSSAMSSATAPGGRSPPNAAGTNVASALRWLSRAASLAERNRRARGVGVIGASTRAVPFERLVVRRSRASAGISRRITARAMSAVCRASSPRSAATRARDAAPRVPPERLELLLACPPSPPRAARPPSPRSPPRRPRRRRSGRDSRAPATIAWRRTPWRTKCRGTWCSRSSSRPPTRRRRVAAIGAVSGNERRARDALDGRADGASGCRRDGRRASSRAHSAMRSSAPRAASCLRSAARMRNLVPVRSVARPPRSLAPVERGVSNPPSPLSFESRKRPLPIERFPPRRTSFFSASQGNCAYRSRGRGGTFRGVAWEERVLKRERERIV